jgi:hypothetical protein
VGGSPPAMPFADHLGAAHSADDIACCLQKLATREAGDGYFDVLTAERLAELIVQCGQDLSPLVNALRSEQIWPSNVRNCPQS